MTLPLHLLFPLFSSVVFVFGMLNAKRAISLGASPWTSTVLANFWLAAGWGLCGVLTGQLLPAAGWWQAALVALSFVAGQVFTYFAYQFGDVSVATPVFGVKVIIVAVLLSGLAGEPISGPVWAGAALATLGVGLIQAGAAAGDRSDRSFLRSVLTIGLALLAATSLSLFDAGLQLWGRQWGASQFLPAMFVCTGLWSCALLPFANRPRQLRGTPALTPLLIGTLLMALQAMSMSWSLSRFGDATRINIVYALRGLWAVALARLLSGTFVTAERQLSRRVMLVRLTGAVLLTASVVIALSDRG
ncbi:MAG TPA: hypothetical protein DCR20_05735 [Planctomycetaceae bacterium]|nr:hypothetical protein [Planctomycetaceae bacterium]